MRTSSIVRYPLNHYDVQIFGLPLLFLALGRGGTCFVLGAGASAPDVPVTGRIPAELRRTLVTLGSWPATWLAPSRLRQLALEAGCPRGWSLDDWKASQVTSPTIAILIEQRLRAVTRCPPQYKVFELFALDASIVSFNWDGLAARYCPQHIVFHPHGRTRARRLGQPELDEMVSFTQMLDAEDGRAWLSAPLVLPGDEDNVCLADVHAGIFNIWRCASTVVVIGYGMGSVGPHDAVWKEIFAEAMMENLADVHVVDPNAAHLAGEFCETLGRSFNVYAWPFYWNCFARAVLHIFRESHLQTIEELAASPLQFLRLYDRLLCRS